MNRLVRAAQSWWEPEHHDDHEVKDSAAAAAAQAREDRAESLAGASSSPTEPEPQPSGTTRAPGPPRSYTDAEKQAIEAGGGLRFVRSTIESICRSRAPTELRGTPLLKLRLAPAAKPGASVSQLRADEYRATCRRTSGIGSSAYADPERGPWAQ